MPEPIQLTPHGPAASDRMIASGRLADGAFLAAIVLLSSASYVTQLGLYSDDWGLLSAMWFAPDQSFGGLFEVLLPTDIRTRPMQGVWLALLYTVFGLKPLGYHVANTLLLAGTAVVLHWALRGLGLPRLVALTVPLVYVLLPHYSTDRFWIAAFQANLAVFFYATSLYSDVEFTRRSDRTRWIWKVAATIALLASVLAYEITAGLFLLNPFIVGYAAHLRRRDDKITADTAPARRPVRVGLSAHGARSWRQFGLLLAVNIVALGLAVAYKGSTSERTAFAVGLLWRVRHTVVGATSTAFGSYGLALPVRVARSLQLHFDPTVAGISLIVGLLVWVWLSRSFTADAVHTLTARAWQRMVAIGFVTFAAGYGVALLTFDIGFDTTGINNRTAAAAALGVATTFVALTGWISCMLRSERLGWAFFRAVVVLLSASGCLLINSIGMFWAEAANRQQHVITVLRSQIGVLPPGSVLLLDGFCRYAGPGVVFETSWDVTGMLHLTYGDRSLIGDMAGPRSTVLPEGVRTILYDDVINVYPFNDRLLILDVGTAAVHTLDSYAAADQYFRARVDVADSCPSGEEGYGARIF